MQTEIRLITNDDIRNIKPISDNIDNVERIDPYIIEAQNLDLRPFLGDPLFYWLLKNKDATANPTKTLIFDLLNGCEYTNSSGDTVYFDGIKIAIAYFAYARLIANQSFNVTRFGVVKKTTDYSEPADSGSIERLSGNARSIALAYLEQAKLFLDDNDGDDKYSLWGDVVSKTPKGRSVITSVKNYDSNDESVQSNNDRYSC